MVKNVKNNKEKVVKVRLTEQEFYNLDMLTLVLGKSKSEIIREYINNLSKLHIK